jgi:GrpB-like predicted nucleotidyltransferase (UPF0157 family)
MIGIEPKKTELHPYENEYKDIAKKTINQLNSIFGSLAIKIEHVGSTAIIGIKSKPIIDIAVGVSSFDVVSLVKEKLEKNEFLFDKIKLNNSIMSYKCEVNGKRTHNIHIVIYGEERWQEFVLFKDYLNMHSKTAHDYENLKVKLSKEYKDSIHDYTEHKSAFILDVLKKAKK